MSHNFKIMNLKNLLKAVEKCHGSEILFSSYMREMTFWFAPFDPGVRHWTWPLFRYIFKPMERLVEKAGISSRWFSPEAIVIARKKQGDRD